MPWEKTFGWISEQSEHWVALINSLMLYWWSCDFSVFMIAGYWPCRMRIESVILDIKSPGRGGGGGGGLWYFTSKATPQPWVTTAWKRGAGQWQLRSWNHVPPPHPISHGSTLGPPADTDQAACHSLQPWPLGQHPRPLIGHLGMA